MLHALLPLLMISAVAFGVIFNHQGSFDQSACIDVLKASGVWVTPDNLPYTGSTDVLIYPGLAIINSAGVDATTLATPIAGAQPAGDDGKILKVLDVGGHAHTIITAADKIVPSHDKLLFNGTAGSYVTLMAYNGLWYVLDSTGITASEV